MTAFKSYLYQVRSYHTDASQRLFVHQILNFLQDAAHNHADGNGFGQKQLESRDLFWVLSRLKIEINELPVQDDSLVLNTWVKSINGSISEREFSIARGEDVLINASSLWFCLSGKTQKPAKIPEEYTKIMIPYSHSATKGGTEKILVDNPMGKNSTGNSIEVKYTDIDMVNHVNNAAYMKWVTNEMSMFNYPERQVKSLTINYLEQAFLGDPIMVSHFEEASQLFVHEVRNMSTDKVVCRIKSTWR
ncbi:MAG: acyl-ACP thioesterase domain-containing protein [Bacteroidota bacterium]